MPEAHRAAQHGRAGKAHLPRFHHDCFIERLVAGLVVLADEDAQEYGVAGERHGQIHLMELSDAASICPSQTPSRHSTTEPTIFPPAWSHSLSWTRLRVCRLNDENVV